MTDIPPRARVDLSVILRYVRALERLKKILTGPAGGKQEIWP
jgi:hypothetical protein